MPARIERIYVVLKNDRAVPRKLKTTEQAARVARRIVKDWIEAQLALVEAEQAEMVEVFLPYAQDQTGQTPYESLEAKNFAQLTHQYFGNQVSVGIVGWPADQARAFIRRLTDHACQPAYQYRHQWQVGDAIFWDNRRVLHAGTYYDLERETRLMHRTTFCETEPVD